ncbi:MAG TPA: hypothetical protein VFF67_10315 [Thermoplasmata archaeon]|nr:hypothetical protein [Thermoplasmata archaeon]
MIQLRCKSDACRARFRAPPDWDRIGFELHVGEWHFLAICPRCGNQFVYVRPLRSTAGREKVAGARVAVGAVEAAVVEVPVSGAD